MLSRLLSPAVSPRETIEAQMARLQMLAQSILHSAKVRADRSLRGEVEYLVEQISAATEVNAAMAADADPSESRLFRVRVDTGKNFLVKAESFEAAAQHFEEELRDRGVVEGTFTLEVMRLPPEDAISDGVLDTSLLESRSYELSFERACEPDFA